MLNLNKSLNYNELLWLLTNVLTSLTDRYLVIQSMVCKFDLVMITEELVDPLIDWLSQQLLTMVNNYEIKWMLNN